MKRYPTRKLLGLVLLFSSLASAADEPPVPPDEFVYCTVCHGVQLMGNPIIKAPRLSGMDAWYVEQQMKNFKKGIRGVNPEDPYGYVMQPMAVPLTDAQIVAVAEFVEMTVSPAAEVTISGDVDSGKAHYSTCAACHGIDGKGNEALGGTDLTPLNDWYLVTQLENFKNGSRGGNPGDIYGMQMRAAVQLLTDDEAIRDVVSYISTLRND
jgi:cytochrome c oxidase subunit 2